MAADDVDANGVGVDDVEVDDVGPDMTENNISFLFFSSQYSPTVGGVISSSSFYAFSLITSSFSVP